MILQEPGLTEGSVHLKGRAFDDSPVGIALCRIHGSLVQVNRAFRAQFGFGVAELENLSLDALRIEHSGCRRRIQSTLRAGLSWLGESQFLDRDWQILDVLEMAYPLPRAEGEADLCVHFLHRLASIPDRLLERLALHDGISCLPNAHLLHERLRRDMARARETGQHLVFLRFDLDLGDEYRCADEWEALVHETVERLRPICPPDALARLAGTAFAAHFLTGDAEEAVRSCGKALSAAFEAPFPRRWHTLRPRVRAAIGAFPLWARDMDELFRGVSAALDRARAADDRICILACADAAA